MLFLHSMGSKRRMIQCEALRISRSLALIWASLLAFSCSTTKLVPDGEHRLQENRIVITNPYDNETSSSLNLTSFYRQKANEVFNFPLWIYNWGDNSGKPMRPSLLRGAVRFSVRALPMCQALPDAFRQVS